MRDLFEKIYNEYLIVLQNLEIGYGFNNCDLTELWELIQTLYFIRFGNPTEKEMLLLADYYGTIGAFLEDIDFDEDQCMKTNTILKKCNNACTEIDVSKDINVSPDRDNYIRDFNKGKSFSFTE